MLKLFPLTALAFALLAPVPGLARGCDILLGTFATEADGDAVIHIVKTKGVYVLSTRQGPGDEWRVLEESMRGLGHAELLSAVPVVDIDAKACGLAARERGMGMGKFFMKVQPGTTYRDNIRPGENWVKTRTSSSGVLLYEMQGIVTMGQDLYRVPFSGKVAVVEP